MTNWTDELRAIRDDLGENEIAQRIKDLSDYEKTADLASLSYDMSPAMLTPVQLVAWAKFAETLGKDVAVRPGTLAITRPKTYDELAFVVCQAERYKRRNS